MLKKRAGPSLLSRAATASLVNRVLEEANVSIGEHRAASARYIAPLDYDPDDPFAIGELLRLPTAGPEQNAHTRHRRSDCNGARGNVNLVNWKVLGIR